VPKKRAAPHAAPSSARSAQPSPLAGNWSGVAAFHRSDGLDSNSSFLIQIAPDGKMATTTWTAGDGTWCSPRKANCEGSGTVVSWQIQYKYAEPDGYTKVTYILRLNQTGTATLSLHQDIFGSDLGGMTSDAHGELVRQK
jgi:hypothetical protein